MRNPVIAVFLCVLLLFAMVGLAFLYIDLTGHKSFHYDITMEGRPYGAVSVDRYITERNLVYKSRQLVPYSIGYPSSTASLTLDRSSKTPVRYVREDQGLKRQKMLISLAQKHDKTDYLFLESPRFLRLEGFSTGETTMVYTPEDIMLVMALMERYSYWKKGTQYFEVMIPLAAPYPPLRDKVAVRYLHEEYVPALGRKVEADIYTISSRGVKETRIAVARHAQRILNMRSPCGMDIILSEVREGPAKLSVFSLRNLPFIQAFFSRMSESEDVEGAAPPGVLKDMSGEEVAVPGALKSREVFFESGNLVLSGRLWIPDGEGPFHTVLIVPGEGPVRKGEKLFTEHMAGVLLDAGYMCLAFDPPGRGKSQGNFYEIYDGTVKTNNRSAFDFLNSHKMSEEGPRAVIALGPAGSGALRASDGYSRPVPVIIISPSAGGIAPEKGGVFSGDHIRKVFDIPWLGEFDENFLLKASRDLDAHKISVIDSRLDTAYFMGVRLPLKGYRAYLARKPYQHMMEVDFPVMLVQGRDAPYLDARASAVIKSSLAEKNPDSQVLLLDGLKMYGGSTGLVEGKWQYIPDDRLFSAVKQWIRGLRIPLDAGEQDGWDTPAFSGEGVDGA